MSAPSGTSLAVLRRRIEERLLSECSVTAMFISDKNGRLLGQ
jgi:hypothetical protein